MTYRILEDKFKHPEGPSVEIETGKSEGTQYVDVVNLSQDYSVTSFGTLEAFGEFVLWLTNQYAKLLKEKENNG